MIFILDIIQKYIQDIISHNRIQPAGGLIQNEKLGIMGKSVGDTQLHFHTFGKGFDFLVGGQLEFIQIVFVNNRIPLTVGSCGNLSHFDGSKRFIKINSVENNADIFLQLSGIFGKLFSPEGNGSFIPLN